METILIARERESGKDVVLAGREVPYPQQLEKYQALFSETNDQYESVGLFYMEPCKRNLRFITSAEKEARNKPATPVTPKNESVITRESLAAKSKSELRDILDQANAQRGEGHAIKPKSGKTPALIEAILQAVAPVPAPEPKP